MLIFRLSYNSLAPPYAMGKKIIGKAARLPAFEAMK